MTEFDLPRRSAYHDDELSKKATAGTDAPACVSAHRQGFGRKARWLTRRVTGAPTAAEWIVTGPDPPTLTQPHRCEQATRPFVRTL